MKQTVTKSMFVDSFSEQYKNNFSYEGKIALFEYLEDLEDGCGTEYELDPIGLCCEFSEYINIEEFKKDYSDDYNSIEDIEEHTTVISVGSDGFIIGQL